MLKLLFIGDIVGRPGREIVIERLPALRMERGIDFVVANAENAAGGAGITGAVAQTLLNSGIDAITLGDHVWDHKGFDAEIASLERVCRPANLPASCPGREYVILEARGFRLGVASLLGRTFMGMKAECPFLGAERLLGEFAGKADGVFFDMHAEATSEKQALGWYLDGHAIAVLGTHTHVPTADAAILPNGTAFMCDVGMTGPYESVLGREMAPVLSRFIDGIPRRYGVADGDVRLSAAIVRFDPLTKRATSCELVTVRK